MSVEVTETGLNLIPAGYKQTEVGVIPEDWEVMRLGHLAKFFKGSGLPKSELSESGKIKCIHYGQLFTTYGPKIDRVISRTENVGIVTSQENDVLMPTSDVTPNGLATASCITETGVTLGGDILIIRSDKQKLNGVFFSYLVNVLRDQVMQLVTGSTVYHLYGSDMAKFEFAFPSKEEQTAIANALSDVDALISELEKLIAKKQAIKTATMQQLLTGRTRLPQFALREDGTPKGTKPSELGEIPVDWEVVTLGTASSFINGRAYSLHEWENSGTPVIRLQNLTGRGDEYYYSNLQLPEKQYCKYGDLLFMWSATFGPVIWRGPKAIYHYHIWKIACEVGYSQSYLFYLLDDMTEKLKRSSSSGGTMLHVTKEKMESTKAAFPSYEEQTAIATILSDMDAEIQALEQRLGKIRQIKQGMMQELLTGKTRLPYDKE
ncbi:restriction endonuclease subunit S [Proteus mirabilis]|nr:restriction endonuclease subunit S [Proteus mirabilis]MBI6281926.1 restriction endonuclease subunit S [Proteus mirabilis]